MQAHGIGEHLCAWITNWLSNRVQRVVLMDKLLIGLKLLVVCPKGQYWDPHSYNICK